MKPLKDFLKAEKHLPDCMKDLHDQKDLFEAMHAYMKPKDCEYTKNIARMEGHVYVVDFFLTFMAHHGYVLQKSKAKVEFEDLDSCVTGYKVWSRQQSAKLLNELLNNEN